MFIVIEKFDKLFPTIVTNEDGTPMLFEQEEQAHAEADECQDGQVVELE